MVWLGWVWLWITCSAGVAVAFDLVYIRGSIIPCPPFPYQLFPCPLSCFVDTLALLDCYRTLVDQPLCLCPPPLLPLTWLVFRISISELVAAPWATKWHFLILCPSHDCFNSTDTPFIYYLIRTTFPDLFLRLTTFFGSLGGTLLIILTWPEAVVWIGEYNSIYLLVLCNMKVLIDQEQWVNPLII